MDSNNPFYYSTNFMDLLNTQQEGNTTNNFSFDLSQNQMSPSEIPQYSTQYSNMGEESDDANGVQNTTDRREARCKWSPTEDTVLISAWLNTSKDPIMSNEQKASAFWKRIAMYYSKSPVVANLPKREWNNCKQRWVKINASVCKFVGCYDLALGQKTSGQSEDDVVKAAYQIYYQDYKCNFTLEHAWRELRHDQKWCSSYNSQNSNGGGSSKRTKFNEGGLYSSSSNPENPIDLDVDDQTTIRPLGVKSSKHKGKKVSTKMTNEEKEANSRSRLEHLWEIREKDLEERKKISKMEVLKSLLAKTEPLSEKEETLKNKLIDEML